MSRRHVGSVAGLIIVIVLALIGNLSAGNSIALGLDLQGGVSVTQEPVGEFNTESLDIAVERIRERVDALGVAEPEIIRQGDAIVVNLPGVTNQEEAIRLVQVTGAVLLRPVLSAQPVDPSSFLPPTEPVVDDVPTTTAAPGPSRSIPRATTPPVSGDDPVSSDDGSDVDADGDTAVDAEPDDVESGDSGEQGIEPIAEVTSEIDEPTTDEIPPPIGGDPNDPNATVVVRNTDGTEIYQLGPAFATGEVFNSDATADIIQGAWGVRVTLRGGASGEGLWNVGAAQCFSGTSACPTRRMAIVLDGIVQSAPTVNQPSFSGGVDITGNFKESEAKDLARVLKSGALPVRLEVQAVQTVSPTLGEDSLQATVVAGLVGIVLVLLFLLLYYRLLAFVMVLGLVLSGAILWNVITFLSETSGLALSLAGSAGIIVSVGITVDSYVVLFEKLKDEIKSGRTLRNSAERGFTSTWRTILSANFVSLLAAFTLWYLTVGSVRGFAFFLGLATLTSLVVSWFFTRPVMMLIARQSRFGARGALGIKNAPGGVA